MMQEAFAAASRRGPVRTHLHHLFGKAGARGRVDLVKLVAGFTSPLAG